MIDQHFEDPILSSMSVDGLGQGRETGSGQTLS